jgi:DNA repair photolyase
MNPTNLNTSTNIRNLPVQERSTKIEQRPEDLTPTTDILEMKSQALDKISSYKSDFDWDNFRKLERRANKKPIRGGFTFKTTFKLLNYHNSCNKCHYAFELDTYGRGCVHNCTYCYAKDQLTTHGFWNRPYPVPVDIFEVRKVFYTVFETNKRSKWRDIMEKRVPLRIGSMSDSFMWMDEKIKVTQELLKILDHYQYPYIIFTRSDLIAKDEYLKLLNKDLASVQFSISGNNETLNRKLEPGAPSYMRRVAALKKLNHAGIWTTVRLNPLFPTYPDGYYSDPEYINERWGSKENVPTLDLMNNEMLDDLKEAGVPSLLAGFVRLSPMAINNMSKSLDIDLKEFYKPEYLEQKGDKRYSDKEIEIYYAKLQLECMHRGIRFNTCYIGNGEKDYYQYQDKWSNKADCCDAIGNVKAFKTTSQSIPWSQRMQRASCKSLVESSMQQELDTAKEFNHVIAKYNKPESLNNNLLLD